MPIKETNVKKGRNLYRKDATFNEKEVKDFKAYRSEDVLNSTVTVDNYTFNADEKSMDRMDRVVDMANWKYNQAVANGYTPADAYQTAYIDITIPWKTYDNQLIEVTIETICKAQEAALYNLSSIWVQYG